MSLTGKTKASTYKDILQMNNSNSGVDATTRNVVDGEGTASAISISDNQFAVRPQDTDGTSIVKVSDKDGNILFVVDSTNSLIKVGTTQSYANTQIKEFGVFDMSPSADAHHAMIAMNGLTSASGGDDYVGANFGTGTDPVTTLTLSSGGEYVVPALWYVPVAITIDEVRVIASTDAADVLNFHLYSYAMATGTGSGAGDLSDGTLLAHNGSTLTTGDDRITTTTLTVDSANTAADRVILAFVENVGDTNDITAQLLVKYHYQ